MMAALPFFGKVFLIQIQIQHIKPLVDLFPKKYEPRQNEEDRYAH